MIVQKTIICNAYYLFSVFFFHLMNAVSGCNNGVNNKITVDSHPKFHNIVNRAPKKIVVSTTITSCLAEQSRCFGEFLSIILYDALKIATAALFAGLSRNHFNNIGKVMVTAVTMCFFPQKRHLNFNLRM